MKVIALGTGTSQGVPIIGCKCRTCLSGDPRDTRLRSALYVETTRTKIAIDIGPDFRQQFLTNNLETVDHILITHEHNDHVIGLDEVRPINFLQQKSIPIYAEERVAGEIRKRFHYAFAKHDYPGLPQIQLKEIDNNPFKIEDIQITPIRILHGRLPIFGFRLNNLAYITDAKTIDQENLNKLQGLDVLIINALRKEEHYSHLNLEGCLEYIEKIGPKRAFITHISHKMGPVEEWSTLLPENVRPLEDNLTINL